MFVYNYFNIIDFNIYNLIFNSCVDKMLYDINNLADYLSDIMAFYYLSIYNNLSNLCFPDQVNYLIKKKLKYKNYNINPPAGSPTSTLCQLHSNN